jgi:hypothetical protein
VTFFAPPKKVTKERGIPGSPQLARFPARYLALLDQPGGLRNSRTVATLADSSDASCWLPIQRLVNSPSARPNSRTGLRCSAALRGPERPLVDIGHSGEWLC